MGKKPDEIECEIKQHREQMEGRISGLQGRVRHDIDSVRGEARGRASGAFGDAKQNLDIERLMRDHTLPSLAGGLSIGVLMGAASEGFGSANGKRKHAQNGSSNGASAEEYTASAEDNATSEQTHDDGAGGGSGLGGLMASALGPAARTAQDELQELVHEGFAAIKGRARRSDDTKAEDVPVKGQEKQGGQEKHVA